MNKTVHAYGVQCIYPGPNGQHYERISNDAVAIYKPIAFLHYWIDDKLQYGEAMMESGLIPVDLKFTSGERFAVELRGPKDYTIKTK